MLTWLILQNASKKWKSLKNNGQNQFFWAPAANHCFDENRLSVTWLRSLSFKDFIKKCIKVRAARSTTILPHSPSVIVFVFAVVFGTVVVWGEGGRFATRDEIWGAKREEVLTHVLGKKVWPSIYKVNVAILRLTWKVPKTKQVSSLYLSQFSVPHKAPVALVNSKIMSPNFVAI